MKIIYFSVTRFMINVIRTLFVFQPQKTGKLIMLFAFSLIVIVVYEGIAYAATSVSILEPENGQTIQNKTSIDFKIMSITGSADCRSVQLSLTIEFNDPLVVQRAVV